MGIRSFLAFELPLQIKEQVGEISKELQQSRLPVRWVKVENIHLTIVFLGPVTEETIAGVKQKAGSIAERFSAFQIRLNRVGVFPNWRRPRVLWIGLDGEIGGLSDLRDELQAALEELGFKPENRPFRPHLTLGRFKGTVNRGEELKWILDRFHDITSDEDYLKELILFKSDLRPAGPVHTKMAAWPLKIL
ncbi:MAG TPA: RNA 2',3'-cyclic phosphodiesterase [Desulfatiglandales bacterium]|nr:RNA 2',3'-cyclic phosphodiesterase [Desulfatiglandales bacterium]